MKLLIITQKVDKNDQLLGFFIDWLKLFADKFENVTVLCMKRGEFELPENVRVISLGKDSGAGKLRQLFNFYRYIFLSKKEYDAVLVHMNPIWMVLGGPAWRLLRKKTFLWYTHKAVTLKLKLAEKFADTIFTASKESFRLKSGKVVVMGHGIDTKSFKPDPNKLQAARRELKILSVGRIAPVKNYETLIGAANILNRRGLDFSVTMVGEAALEEDRRYEMEIKKKIEELGLASKFNFAGKINHRDLPGIYQSHDIFVHLSKTGSVDKTLLEAMACGIKVLSSNDSARAFLPEELLFDENEPAGLADKIIKVKDAELFPGLRDYILNSHNLENLITNINRIINA